MIKFEWNGVPFSVTDLGGGKLGEAIPNHTHAKGSYELHFVTKGKGSLVVDGKKTELKENDFFITGPNIIHSQDFDRNDPIEDVFILIQTKNEKNKNAISSIFLENHFCYLENVDNKLAQELLAKYRKKEPSYESEIAGYMMILLSQTVRLLLPADFNSIISKDDLNDRRFAIIEQAFLYEKDLTLSKLAQMIGLCERQTQRLLVKYYNKSFRELKNSE